MMIYPLARKILCAPKRKNFKMFNETPRNFTKTCFVPSNAFHHFLQEWVSRNGIRHSYQILHRS